MKKMINNYINYVEDMILDKKINSSLIDDLLINISFFQHERLIHFLVTMLVSIITIILLVTNLFINNIFLFLLFIVFICLLIPYIFHYYSLENKIQYMYKIYNTIKDKIKK